jgi:putative two-component system response regulator
MVVPHVLIVDDNAANIKILREILGTSYRVSSASDGKTALEMVEEDPPDVVLLDIVMPDMTGYDVLKSLRDGDRSGHIPVVFVSSRGEFDDKLDGFEKGASGYIAKPADPDEVRFTVRRALSGR